MKNWMLAAGAALLLGACGGGGGGGSGSSGSGSVTGAGWEPAVNTSPASTYSNDAQTIYNNLNVSRIGMGVGGLKENAQLDAAAANHLNWIVANAGGGVRTPDSEVPNTPDYTGATVQQRASAAGYAGTQVDEYEEVAYDGLGKGLTGADCISDALLGVFSRMTLTGVYVDVGIAFNNDGKGDMACVVTVGVSPALSGFWAGQIPANFAVYPYPQQTGVATAFYPAGENPNPDPAAGVSPAGTPITVSLISQALATANPGGYQVSDVVINSFTLTNAGTGTAIPMTIATVAGYGAGSGVDLTTYVDPSYLCQYCIYAIPLNPFTANTTYNVSFTATVNGQAAGGSWSFTTGSQ